jgi:hypothetical protein
VIAVIAVDVVAMVMDTAAQRMAEWVELQLQHFQHQQQQLAHNQK